MNPRRGFLLLIVVGILGIVAVLATCFVTLARLERLASQRRTHAVKAYLLARSGIEDALARLSAGQDPEVRPGFDAVNASGTALGYSGALKGDHAPRSNVYGLKLCSGGFYVNGGDPAQPADLGYNAVLKRILGTLAEAIDQDVLAGVMQADDGLPVDQADGEKLITRRPVFGWTSFQEIRDTAFADDAPDVRRRKLENLKPYLSLHAWVDRKVIKPNFDPPGGTLDYQGAFEIKQGHRQDIPGSYAPGFETIHDKNVGRAPVDFAWARRRRPALIALLAGLSGFYPDESAATAWASGNLSGKVRKAEITNVWSISDDCHDLTDKILTSTREAQDWQQFNALCDSLPAAMRSAQAAYEAAEAAYHAAEEPFYQACHAYNADPNATTLAAKNAAVSNYSNAYYVYTNARATYLAACPPQIQEKLDILKANFNPNTDLNKCNPNQTLWKQVDKSDLLVYSTEFSFQRNQEHTLESTGRVLERRGRLLATRTLKIVVSGPSVACLSTQKDFVAVDLGTPEESGDESGVRLPGQTAFISQSRGPGLEKTWGHALPGLGQGVSLQSYPEPCVRPAATLLMNPADYDGNLQLATVETDSADCYSVNTPPNDLMCLASFNEGFDLDAGDAWPANPDGKKCQVFGAQLRTVDLGNGIFQASGLNTLYPDGAYSETQRVPAFLGKGNMHPFHGVLSFWVKPNYQVLTTIPRAHAYVMASNCSRPESQYFFVGDNDAHYYTNRGLWFQFEIGNNGSDTNREHRFLPKKSIPQAHRWSLVTAGWDLFSEDGRTSGKILSNEGTGPRLGATEGYYAENLPSSATDLTADGQACAHVISVGPLADRDYSSLYFHDAIASGADATFDEFAIWDFGGAPPGGGPVPQASLNAPGILAMNRYKAGRYYKGAAYRTVDDPNPVHDEAASWLSAPIRLPSGSRLRKVCWTWYRPQELPDDYAQLELVDPVLERYLWSDARSTKDPLWTPFRQEWNVQRTVPGALRARVVFRRMSPLGGDPPNTPLLDSPVFDDLTLLYDPPGGPRMLSYGG